MHKYNLNLVVVTERRIPVSIPANTAQEALLKAEEAVGEELEFLSQKGLAIPPEEEWELLGGPWVEEVEELDIEVPQRNTFRNPQAQLALFDEDPSQGNTGLFSLSPGSAESLKPTDG